jgi:hypothetical protein
MDSDDDFRPCLLSIDNDPEGIRGADLMFSKSARGESVQTEAKSVGELSSQLISVCLHFSIFTTRLISAS